MQSRTESFSHARMPHNTGLASKQRNSQMSILSALVELQHTGGDCNLKNKFSNCRYILMLLHALSMSYQVIAAQICFIRHEVEPDHLFHTGMMSRCTILSAISKCMVSLKCPPTLTWLTVLLMSLVVWHSREALEVVSCCRRQRGSYTNHAMNTDHRSLRMEMPETGCGCC